MFARGILTKGYRKIISKLTPIFGETGTRKIREDNLHLNEIPKN